MRIATVGALVIGALFVTAPVWAHHSFAAEYDVNKRMTLKGTITSIEFVNPHAWLHMDVKDANGKVVNWAVEMGTPNMLIRRGFTKSSVPAGTAITVDGFGAKDGSTTINGTTLKLPDGTQLFTGSTAPGAPGAEPPK
jgi:hypothetical protein